MNVKIPLALLGGISPEQFMTTYWQKKPLLVRSAIAGFSPLVSTPALFAFAADEGVESRLVEQKKGVWSFKHGPIARPPPRKRADWTLLVQGVDMLHDGVHQLLQQFRFVPDARLDDLMISYASAGGGVGPHCDSYDVFLLQASGRRRWRIGAQKDISVREDLPLKILNHFAPTQTFDLAAGDMLYLPPRYAHEGVALDNDCQTYSIGFRAPSREELARELLHRIADEVEDETLYADRAQAASAQPGLIPSALQDFADAAVAKALKDRNLMQQILGEYLTEPKSTVYFTERKLPGKYHAVRLDRKSRMMYDTKHVFFNGDSWRVAGADARLLRKLADQRFLNATDLGAASAQLTAAFGQFISQGWLHADI